MKSVFRKIRGKKKDGDVVQNTPANTQSYSAPAPALQSTLPDRDARPSPVQSESPSQVQQHNQTQNQDAAPVTGPPEPKTLSFTSVLPLDQMASIMAQPASAVTQDPRQLIQITQPGLCTVCYHFDAQRAPQDGDAVKASWARREYNIPDNTPSSRVTIQKSETLIESVKNGCVYCTMIKMALDTTSPGWQEEKTFLDIYLAAGLPVIVYLEFGSTMNLALSRAEMLSMGIDLPEDRNMTLTVTIRDDSKPAIELEIYRPIIPDSQLLAGDVALSPLIQHVGFAEEIPTHAGDQQCFDFIKGHVNTCVKQHKCGKDGPMPLLPDRVLWVEADTASGIQLIEPKNIRAPFIAVSYCWGPVGPDTYLTDANTLNARKAGIELHELPPLFQDVVAAARKLGIEYIWIDRLCIIQGADEDFQAQAPKMAEIYGNATLTIAAASAATENDRILVARGDKWRSYELNIGANPIGNVKLKFRRLSHPLGKEESGGDYGKVSTRAWIWQERLLAARTVFFTPGALKFECRCHSFWEGFDIDLLGHSWSAKLDDMTHLTWTGLVEEYMAREITRSSDRLPAMDAVMKRIEKATGWSPFWGLWTNSLIESLSWSSKRSDSSGVHECRMNPERYAPTWSWASIDGPISYVHAKPFSQMENNDPMQWDPECRSLNGASGLIRFSGQLVVIGLHATIKRNEPQDGVPPRHEFSYDYNIKGDNEEKGFPISADVALKPWNGVLDGQSWSTVVRVPYGESPPQQSWASDCACLLIGKRKMRALVMLLGRSLSVPGAWERIGIVDGLSPQIFPASQRRIVDIV